MKYEFPNEEEVVKDFDGWELLIGLDLLQRGKEILGPFAILRVEDSEISGVRQYTIKDEQEHLLFVKTKNGKVTKFTVYNKVFTISGT